MQQGALLVGFLGARRNDVVRQLVKLDMTRKSMQQVVEE